MKAKRLQYALLFLVLLTTEVCIALFVHDDFVRPYLGDVLVTVLICTFARIFFSKSVRMLPLYVFLLAVAVEIGQHFDMVKILGLENNRFFSVLLGTTFSVYDLLCYGIGCVLFTGIDYLINHNRIIIWKKS